MPLAMVSVAASLKSAKSSPDRRKLGPYSRVLRRGVIGTSAIDGRSREGRYLRDLEAQLIAHSGGAPSITQRLLIERVTRTTVQLNKLDKKLLAGDSWTDHDSRTHGGLINRQRLLLRWRRGRQAAPTTQPYSVGADPRAIGGDATRPP
jgi:hypothetical protein